MAKRRRFHRRRRRRFRKFRKFGKRSHKRRIFRQVKRKILKKKFRRRKKRLVRTIEHVINHDTPLGTYKHLGVIALMNPNNKKALVQNDMGGRPLNFNSPTDIRYIASVLFNGQAPLRAGYGGLSPPGGGPNMLQVTALKVQVIRHYVKWCVRNCDRLPITLVHYEFIPTMNGSVIGGYRLGAPTLQAFAPLQAWAACFSDFDVINLDNDVAGTPASVTTPPTAGGLGTATFINWNCNLMVEPGDVAPVLRKYYRVKKRIHKLLPGQCKVLGTTNRLSNKEFVYSGPCLDFQQTEVQNFVDRKHGIHSSWHVFATVPEVEWQTYQAQNQATDGGVPPDQGTTEAVFFGTIPVNAVTFPGASKFASRYRDNVHGTTANGVAVWYKQFCRMRAPRNAPLATMINTIAYNAQYSPAIALGNVAIQDFEPMNPISVNGPTPVTGGAPG